MSGTPDQSERPEADAPRTPERGSATDRSVALRVLCVLVGAQAVALAVAGVAFLTGIGGDAPTGALVFLAVFCVGLAALLGGAARGLWRGRRWGRAPVVTWQLFLGVLAVAWFQASGDPWAFALLALAVVVVALVVWPSVVRVTT